MFSIKKQFKKLSQAPQSHIKSWKLIKSLSYVIGIILRAQENEENFAKVDEEAPEAWNQSASCIPEQHIGFVITFLDFSKDFLRAQEFNYFQLCSVWFVIKFAIKRIIRNSVAEAETEATIMSYERRFCCYLSWKLSLWHKNRPDCDTYMFVSCLWSSEKYK